MTVPRSHANLGSSSSIPHRLIPAWWRSKNPVRVTRAYDLRSRVLSQYVLRTCGVHPVSSLRCTLGYSTEYSTERRCAYAPRYSTVQYSTSLDAEAPVQYLCTEYRSPPPTRAKYAAKAKLFIYHRCITAVHRCSIAWLQAGERSD